MHNLLVLRWHIISITPLSAIHLVDMYDLVTFFYENRCFSLIYINNVTVLWSFIKHDYLFYVFSFWKCEILCESRFYMIRTNRMFYKKINKQLINVTQMDKYYYIICSLPLNENYKSYKVFKLVWSLEWGESTGVNLFLFFILETLVRFYWH